MNALARFDPDVLTTWRPVRYILLRPSTTLAGLALAPTSKDGSAPKISLFAAQIVTADDLSAGYRQILDRAHQHHIRVFAATMTPYEEAITSAQLARRSGRR